MKNNEYSSSRMGGRIMEFSLNLGFQDQLKAATED